MLNTPSAELGLLLRAMTGAERLARCGAPEWGSRLLSGHVCRAQEAAQAGCPWAEEFVAAYRLTLADYLQSLAAQ